VSIGQAVSIGPHSRFPDWTMTMRMSLTRIFALVVLAALLIVAEFGPSVLGDQQPKASCHRRITLQIAAPQG
jgi:hypothetical protein